MPISSNCRSKLNNGIFIIFHVNTIIYCSLMIHDTVNDLQDPDKYTNCIIVFICMGFILLHTIFSGFDNKRRIITPTGI